MFRPSSLPIELLFPSSSFSSTGSSLAIILGKLSTIFLSFTIVILFNFIISGTYYFPESSLKSIKIGLQSDSTRFITKNSTYNSGTGRGYNYSGYSNYIIGNINYSKWSWTFPGSLQTGSNADTDYGWRLGNNFTPPDEPGLKGKVTVSFVVEKDGSLTDIKVLKDIGYGSGREAERVMRKSPKWTPAEQNGRKVRCAFIQTFSIENPDE